jgi:hypothetical protein
VKLFLRVMSLLALAIAPPAAHASNCAGTSTGMIPVNDLGPGFYKGVQGGLYPGGSNVRPAAHEAAGVAIANSMTPLDTLGQPDAVNGHVVFVSIGMSNCTQEFSAFVPKSTPTRAQGQRAHDRLRGGRPDRADPGAAHVGLLGFGGDAAPRPRLGAQAGAGRVVEGRERESHGHVRGHHRHARGAVLRIVQILKAKLPNVKQVFFTSRIYAGYASTTLNPEPYAYENAFAIKRVIAQQLAGDPALNYDPGERPGGGAVAVVGPVSLGRRLEPALRRRSRGRAASSNSSDGTHPSTTGRAKVADSLLAFARRDAATAPWYTIPGTLGVPQPGGAAAGVRLSVTPNPSAGRTSFTVTAPARHVVAAHAGGCRRAQGRNGVRCGIRVAGSRHRTICSEGPSPSWGILRVSRRWRSADRHIVRSPGRLAGAP